MEELIKKIQESEKRMDFLLGELASYIRDADSVLLAMVELTEAINADLKEIIKKASN